MNKEKIEALQTANEYMDNLKKGIIDLSNMIQEGKEQQAISVIPQVVDGLQWIIQVVSLTREVQKNEIKLEGLNDQLQEIIEALENEDYILVGDLFNYEILPILENIHEGIRETVANSRI